MEKEMRNGEEDRKKKQKTALVAAKDHNKGNDS